MRKVITSKNERGRTSVDVIYWKGTKAGMHYYKTNLKDEEEH